MKRLASIAIAFLFVLASLPLSAQPIERLEPRFQEPPAEPPAQGPPGRGPRGRRGGEQEEQGIQPYEKVITEEAETQDGVFKVHRIKNKLFYEIPASELGKEFVLVSRIARNAAGVGYGGQKLGTRVVRWDREDDRVLFQNVSHSVVAAEGEAIRKAVEAANNHAIIQSFEVKAEGPDDSVVIDVSNLYISDIFELSAKSRLQARGMDRSRSFLEEVSAFPQNIEVRATHTYTKPPEQVAAGRRAPTPASRFRRGMNPGTASIVLHHSMVKLPEDPMQPRLFDHRVGYFSVRQIDYSRGEHRAQERRYITRWRLEKKDPSAELSEPVKPIVYWIDPATPPKWVPYMKKGVEDWQVAFEEAGFKNAILAKEAPTPDEDPSWSPEDARYSVIRWLPSTIQNASGPHVNDPRTGEILESDIQFYHNIQQLLTSWYFLQVGPLDPRAKKLPLPDDLMGELLRYVVAHEVGHTLGFQHNMKSSSTYTVDQVRDPKWVKKMGHVATLMDYSRFNYVAQPEDGIPPQDLFPKIGPYDRWATMWGYKPIPEAGSPDAEKETLHRWALEQDDKPWLRFSTANANGSDPGALTEAVGDGDAVRATELGLKNLSRVSAMLLPATTHTGEDWRDLGSLYGSLLGQWVREMGHVVALVGGFHSQQKHAGQDGVIFEPVPYERQAEAVRFLNTNAFRTPEFMVRKEILRRIEPDGVLSRLGGAQTRLLRALLSDVKLRRLVEQEALDGDSAYKATDFLADLREGIWAELQADRLGIDAFRRNVQRAYLQVIDAGLNGSSPVSGDARALLRAELQTLDRQLELGLQAGADRMTRAHLLDARDQIQRTLDPKFQRSSGAAAGAAGRRALEDADLFGPADVCWPELIIRP